MDEQFDFRALLLKLQDCLSIDDRRRLHFLMGDMIPRQIRDDPTLGGTLHLLESLFDQGKIDTQDFGYLIHAFREIGCHTAVKRLNEHQRARHPKKSENLLQQLIDDTDDKIQHIDMHSLMLSKEIKPRSGTFSNFSEGTNEKMKIHRRSSTKSRLIFCHTSLFLANLISIITCIILLIIVKKPNTPTRDIILALIGPYHGEPAGGKHFNDAKDCLLTFNDRVIAVIGGGTKREISYLSFIYSNCTSTTRGTILKNAEQYKFKLRSDEYIDHVTVYTGTRLIVNSYKPNGTFLVVGLRFRTNQGRFSGLFGSDDGEEKEEFYKGYHLGYVHGQAEGYIDALQFIWYKEATRADSVLLLEQ